jgi:hypothetical protein
VTGCCAEPRRLCGGAFAVVLGLGIGAMGGGCGSENRAPSTSPAGSPAPVRLSIDSPQPGAMLQPTRLSPSRVQVTVELAGHADSATPVQLDAGCAARPCRATFFSDGAGEWKTQMRLRLPSSRRLLVITASAPASGVRPARLTLRVDRAPKAAAPTRRRRSRPSRPDTTPSPPQPAPPASGSSTTSPSPAPSAPEKTPAQTQPAPSTDAGRGTLILVGDSLAVGIRSALPAQLPGWQVTVDGRVSRPLAEGMSVLAATPVPSDGSAVLAISLFTNDDPTHTSQLQAAVSRTLSRVGANGCVVWATVARPPVDGVSYDAANTLLRRLARADSRLKLVPWAEQTAAQPSLLGPDGVHPTPAGYQLRARLYAQAARSC